MIPRQISEDASNGITYEIDDWFSFSTTSIYLRLQVYFPAFHALIVNSGMANTRLNTFNFISDSENYTVFAPSAEALAAARVDTMTLEQKKSFILLHFIRKEMIFTDGSQSGGYYETTRPDERSSEFTTLYTKIYIDTNYDEIVFPAGAGGTYHTILESDSTNILAGQSLSEGNVTFPQYINTAVIHRTNKALDMNELDVN